MNKQLRDEWVKALRSGKYKQGTGELHDDLNDEYCCLGVLCDVAKVRSFRDKQDLDEHGLRTFRDRQKLGTNEEGEIQAALISMNDDDGLTFHEIADWIEANVPVES